MAGETPTYTYSGDPSNSDLDEARFLIQDTDMDDPIMNDQEIEYLIDRYGANRTKLEYELFSQAATKFARAIKRKLGPQEEDPSGRTAFYAARIEELRRLMASTGLSQQRGDPTKIFYRNMQSNPPWPNPSRRGGG